MMTSTTDQNNKAHNASDETILSARIHEYREPLTIDRIAKPIVSGGEQVLLRVGDTIEKFSLNKINEALDSLRAGQIVGRGVVIP
jgi:hypothetical protein